MQILGIDLGFGFTKATNGERSLVVKSVIGEATDQQFGGPMPEARLGDDHLHIEMEDRGIFAGDLAERQSSLRSFTLDQDRFITDSAKVLALAVASDLAASDEPINLVTGLPISSYRAKSDELARLLRDRHAFTVIDPDGKRHRTVLEISDVRVIPQPFGSMYDMVLDDAGKVGDRAAAAAEDRHRRHRVPDLGPHRLGPRHASSSAPARAPRPASAAPSRRSRARSARRAGSAVELYRLYEAMERGPHQDPRRQLRPQPAHRARADASWPRTSPPTRTACGPTSGTWTPSSSPAAAAPCWRPYLAPLLSGRVLPVETGPRRPPQQRPRVPQVRRADLGGRRPRRSPRRPRRRPRTPTGRGRPGGGLPY